MSVVIELTPALFSMLVIALTKDAVYLRLPQELQRDCGGCACQHCKRNPELAKWDTLVVPFGTDDKYQRSYTVHMPAPSVGEFNAYIRRTGGGAQK